MRRPLLIEHVLVVALLTGTLVLGATLRLEDPLSTRALAAEDPYTHVVFTKEWIEKGAFGDSFHLGTGMYPPGMHAFVGAFAPLAGVSLYEFARIAPAFFGALAILGMFVLGQRLSGNPAGLAAAFVTAILPEHIFRTELLFPTAVDLAVLPIWLLGYHLAITTHRKEGAILFLGAGVPLAIMHPWLVPLFAVPLALYASLRALRRELPSRELPLAATLLVPPTAFAMAFRWDESDTGFADFFAALGPLGILQELHVPRPLLFLVLLILLGAVAALGAFLLRLTLVIRPPRPFRLAIGAVVASALLASIPWVARDLPREVDYSEMIGPLAILLALAGFALAFMRPSALGDLGAAIAIPLFPLTAIDVFDSPFWPQRTVAYLCVGVALLAASSFGHLHALPLRLARVERSRVLVGATALVVLSGALVGTAAATYDDVYPWYRLYNEDHFARFEEVARVLEKDPSSKVFVYGWQPALIVKTLTDPAHVWYAPSFFADSGERTERLDKVEGPAYVLVDKHTLSAENDGKASLDFLDDGSRYRLVTESEDGRLRLYEVRG